MLYGSLLSAHLEELTRAREERATAAVDFSELSNEQTRFKIQASAQASKNSITVDPKKVPNEPSVPKKAGWLTKKEYLAKLEAERSAIQLLPFLK